MCEKRRLIIVLFLLVSMSSVLLCAAPEKVSANSGLPGISEITKYLTKSASTSQAPEKNESSAEEENDGQTTDAEAQKAAQETPDSAEGWAEKVWTFPILKTGDAWIPLNQLVLALGILILGGFLAAAVSRLVGRFFNWFKGPEHNIGLIAQKTTFYALFLIVLIFVIQLANVPLAFLTLLLTAVAIGASIGARNTIYDYLSGLILAVERPLRVGDCVEVDSQRGFITEIAGRFTIMRRFDGINALVPNSKLLENSVINWTLLDHKLRGEVELQVTYGSPAGKVDKLIRQAIEEHEETLKTPAAGVQLWEFGQNGLVFWSWFWADVNNPLDIWRLESDIRFRILELFEESEITIAYPQRYLHLDPETPITIQFSEAQGGETRQDRGEEIPEEDVNITFKKTQTENPQGNRDKKEEKEAKDELRDGESNN